MALPCVLGEWPGGTGRSEECKRDSIQGFNSSLIDLTLTDGQRLSVGTDRKSFVRTCPTKMAGLES